MSTQQQPEKSGSTNDYIGSRTDELEKQAENKFGPSDQWKLVEKVFSLIPRNGRTTVATIALAFIALVTMDKFHPRPETAYIIGAVTIVFLMVKRKD